eukprot:scaffold260951_cov23-Tisochrysis_lutea.AAC.3
MKLYVAGWWSVSSAGGKSDWEEKQNVRVGSETSASAEKTNIGSVGGDGGGTVVVIEAMAALLAPSRLAPW